MQRARVDYGLRVAIAAQNHLKVRDPGRAAFVVQVDDAVALQSIERQLHHADGTLYDLGPSGNDRLGLLTLEHRGGDLRRVGQVADPRLDHFDACLGESLLNIDLELLADLDRAPARGDLGIVAVVGVAARQYPQGGLALNPDEVPVVVDLDQLIAPRP